MSPLRRLARALFSRDKAGPDADEPVTVAISDNEPTAELWRAMLEGNGIPSVVRTRGGLAHFRGLPGGTWELRVRHRDVGRAKGVLGTL